MRSNELRGRRRALQSGAALAGAAALGFPSILRARQLLQEMYVVKVKDAAQMRDKWDFFEVVRSVPRADQPRMGLQPRPEDNACSTS